MRTAVKCVRGTALFLLGACSGTQGKRERRRQCTGPVRLRSPLLVAGGDRPRFVSASRGFLGTWYAIEARGPLCLTLPIGPPKQACPISFGKSEHCTGLRPQSTDMAPRTCKCAATAPVSWRGRRPALAALNAGAAPGLYAAGRSLCGMQPHAFPRVQYIGAVSASTCLGTVHPLSLQLHPPPPGHGAAPMYKARRCQRLAAPASHLRSLPSRNTH